MAFIGSVGIPNCYGGFESFLESVAPVIASQGHHVIVTCDKRRYKAHPAVHKGVHLEYVPIPANGALSQVHDLVAFFKVVWKVDTVVVLGVSAGFFFIIMRLFASLFGKNLLVNIDGVEWRRSKFSKKVRLILRIFDALAQLCATTIVYDNPDLLPYIFPRFRKKAQYIAYPGDHVIRLPQLVREQYGLTICRIEPENNIEMLIQGALASHLMRYVIIGNWQHSSYGINLKARYSNEPRLSLLDPIYDAMEIASYREKCAIYLHGHSVGGTNPSLVEMLFYDCFILCFDCSFNRSTAGNNAEYFDSSKALALRLDQVRLLPYPPKRSMRRNYTADSISAKYIQASFGSSAQSRSLSEKAAR